MFLSTRLSAVRSAVFTLPDCHNPTMTSTAPLSLDPPSKVVPSISPLTQWQQPVLFCFVFFPFVWLWLVVLSICKWDWRVSTKAETIPPLATHQWSPAAAAGLSWSQILLWLFSAHSLTHQSPPLLLILFSTFEVSSLPPRLCSFSWIFWQSPCVFCQTPLPTPYLSFYCAASFIYAL